MLGPDVLVLSGDEKSPAAAALSIRSGHPYVQWVGGHLCRSLRVWKRVLRIL